MKEYIEELLYIIKEPHLMNNENPTILSIACSTYTKIIESIETAPKGSDLAEWRTQKAPKIGVSYWHLGEEGTVLDLIYAVRADEAEHRDVNHSVVAMKPGDVNPRYDPKLRIDDALNKYVRAMMTRSANMESTSPLQ